MPRSETAPEATTKYRFKVSVRSYSFTGTVQDLVNIVINSEWQIIEAKKYLPIIKEKAFIFLDIIQDIISSSARAITGNNLTNSIVHDTELLATSSNLGLILDTSIKYNNADHINICLKNLYDVILVETLLVEGFLKGRKKYSKPVNTIIMPFVTNIARKNNFLNINKNNVLNLLSNLVNK